MEWLKNIFSYDPEAPMLFTGFSFWVFFGVLLLFYSIIYKKNAVRNVYLFAMSLFFYYKTGGYFFSLLIFSTIVDYTLGNLIYQSPRQWKKKLFVAMSVIVNLGVLSYFKYSYFFTDIVNQIFNTDLEVVNWLAVWANDLTGGSFNVSTIILPVGISFYTFQTISYTVDIYRQKTEPVKNILDFGFYVSFFPQLVAGPIVRASEFVPQIYKKYNLSKREFGLAVFLILNGLIKKMLISDYIAINFVDRIFADPATYSGFENLMAIYGYSLQIYCDFSGYTDVAIGVALLMGFRLPWNFNSPYKAPNITDFWRRWHISLSTWLRDYLYIPLGGNKKGKTRMYVNLMITMLLGGLWHGAATRFVIWGGLHGVWLAIHKAWMKTFGKPDPAKSTRLKHFVSVFFSFHLVTFAWIFFRSPDMDSAGIMLNQMFHNFAGDLVPQMVKSYWVIFSLMVGGFIIHWLPKSFKDQYTDWFIKTPVWGKILIASIVVIILYQAQSAEVQPFIYFQF